MESLCIRRPKKGKYKYGLALKNLWACKIGIKTRSYWFKDLTYLSTIY